MKIITQLITLSIFILVIKVIKGLPFQKMHFMYQLSLLLAPILIIIFEFPRILPHCFFCDNDQFGTGTISKLTYECGINEILIWFDLGLYGLWPCAPPYKIDT